MNIMAFNEGKEMGSQFHKCRLRGSAGSGGSAGKGGGVQFHYNSNVNTE